MEIVFHSEPNPPGTANASTCLCPGWWPTRSATTRGSTTPTSPSCGDIQGENNARPNNSLALQARIPGQLQRTLHKRRQNYEICAKKELKRWSCCSKFKCWLPGDPSGGGQRGIAKGSNEALWSSRSTRGESIGSVFFIQHSIYCFRMSFTTVHSHSVFMIKITQ